MYGSVEGSRDGTCIHHEAVADCEDEPHLHAAEPRPQPQRQAQRWHQLRAGFGTAVALLALAYAGVMATKHYTPDSDPSLLTSGSGSAGASASASASASNAVDYSSGPAAALAANELATHTLATDAIAITHDNYEVVLSQHEFFDFPRVAEWLATKNVYRDSTQAELSQYLPEKVSQPTNRCALPTLRTRQPTTGY